MNLLKATIATAAVITCCLGNEMPAQARPSADEIRQNNKILKQAVKYAEAGNFKDACTTFKKFTQAKLTVGGFNYNPGNSSHARKYNQNVAKTNDMHNGNGRFLCEKAGMIWIDVALPQQAAASQVSSVSSNIRSHCEREWGTNYRMIKYCVDTQTKAANALGY